MPLSKKVSTSWTIFIHNCIETDSGPDPKAGGLRRKLSSCLQRLTLTSAPPTIPAKHRPSDGRPKLVQRSENFSEALFPTIAKQVPVDDHPTGYPQLAAFVNSDGNFFICRKYGFLRNRVLLYRQDELSCLEKELIALDQDNSKRRPFALTSRKHDEETDDDPNYSYKAVMQKIDNKLKEYGKQLWVACPLLQKGKTNFTNRRTCEPNTDLCRAQKPYPKKCKQFHTLDTRLQAPYEGRVYFPRTQGRFCGSFRWPGMRLAGRSS